MGTQVKMERIKVVSLNTWGLMNDLKRRKVFRYLKRTDADICFIQETHCNKNLEKIFLNEWGAKCWFSNGESNARGVAILCNKKFANKVVEVHRDLNGRFIICKMNIGEYNYAIANVYAPNVNNAGYFNEIFEKITAMNCIHVIIGGDFNVVQDVRLDRSIERDYNKLNKLEIEKAKEALELCDIWRIQNPDKKCFTWMKGKEKISWSRIDYFLVSQSLCNLCTKTDISPSVQTDHSLISMEWTTEEVKRGPGIWKMNEQLLQDEAFCQEMENILKGVLRGYSHLNKTDKWELLKFEAARFAKDISRERAFKRKNRKFLLYKQLSRMQQELIKDNSHNEIKRNIDKISAEIDAFETIDAKKAAFRCRKEYQKSGETSSKYFFNLEKRNFVTKTMYVARKENGELTKDYREILEIQVAFFRKLYTCDHNTHFDLSNTSGITLNPIYKNAYEEIISEDELFDAIMTLKLGKTQGCDGLGLNFYRKFWKIVKTPMYEMFVECVEAGQLSPSAKRGIINLIPKKLKDVTQVKNLRPIVILNYDFKIWAKAIANRLDTVAGDLIGKQQYGFMRGRNIVCNIRKTVEIVGHLNKSNLPGIIIQIDFEKCFDRVDFKAIEKTFAYFGFGSKFISMLMLLYSNLELCTVNNGYFSNFMKKGRGGEPRLSCQSPGIYLLWGNHVSYDKTKSKHPRYKYA